ncbi:MAG: helix-turn-helix domain-containing protein [Bermanella sp.]
MRQPQSLRLNEEEYVCLTDIVKRHSSSIKLKERTYIVLLAHHEVSNVKIANLLNISRQKVARWRSRFHQQGLCAIEKAATRPGRKEELASHVVNQVLHLTLKQNPPNGKYWTQKSVAQMCGVSSSSVRRIWEKHNISPKKNTA